MLTWAEDAYEDDEPHTLPRALVRLGIEFPDGAKVTNLVRRWPRSVDEPEPSQGLTPSSGSSSGGKSRQVFWAWSLPGPGQIRFVCEWPKGGIAESSLVLDGELFHDANDRAQPVWPDEPPRSHATMHSAIAAVRRQTARSRSETQDVPHSES